MFIKCNYCGNLWDYRGDQPIMCKCHKCQLDVRITKNKVKSLKDLSKPEYDLLKKSFERQNLKHGTITATVLDMLS